MDWEEIVWLVAFILVIVVILIGIAGLVAGDFSQLISIVIQFIGLYYLRQQYLKP